MLKPPRWLVARLAVAIVLDTAVHILWKLGADSLPQTLSAAGIADAARQPLFYAVGALFACQLVNWLRVLEASDLSYSQPITALSLVSVLAVSALGLGERVDAAKIAGTALVFAGVWFISRTPHDSRPPRKGHA